MFLEIYIQVKDSLKQIGSERNLTMEFLKFLKNMLKKTTKRAYLDNGRGN